MIRHFPALFIGNGTTSVLSAFVNIELMKNEFNNYSCFQAPVALSSADCFAAVKAFIYYRLCCCCCKDDEDDTAPNENATRNSDAWEHAQQGDKNNSNVDSLLLSLRRYHWFHKVDRETAHRMVRSGGQGCFMVRPSESGQSPIALTVWHEGRPYNVFIRIRDDNCVALGSAKYHEMVFPNVESLIRYHHVEELILMTNKRKAGKTLLICTPTKSRFEDV